MQACVEVGKEGGLAAIGEHQAGQGWDRPRWEAPRSRHPRGACTGTDAPISAPGHFDNAGSTWVIFTGSTKLILFSFIVSRRHIL